MIKILLYLILPIESYTLYFIYFFLSVQPVNKRVSLLGAEPLKVPSVARLQHASPYLATPPISRRSIGGDALGSGGTISTGGSVTGSVTGRSPFAKRYVTPSSGQPPYKVRYAFMGVV